MDPLVRQASLELLLSRAKELTEEELIIVGELEGKINEFIKSKITPEKSIKYYSDSVISERIIHEVVRRYENAGWDVECQKDLWFYPVIKFKPKEDYETD